jgi:ABC-type multidrug transport system fused ATPase/permease subunit
VIALLFAISIHYKCFTNVGLLALSFTKVFDMLGNMQGFLNLYTETQLQFISVERTNTFQELESEKRSTFDTSIPNDFNAQLVFDNVTLKYKEHGAPALKDFSCTIK